MFDYHVAIGVVASVIGAVAYIPYFRDIVRGTTKPHVFTWTGFGLLNALVFLGQITKGAGPGAWVTGLTTIASFSIALTALRRGERVITTTDWVCFIGAIVGIILWKITNEPLTAVVIATVADAFAFIPTVRKSYWKPNEETLVTYVLGTVKYFLSLFALGSFSVTTVLFPASISLLNAGFIAMVLLRRRQLRADT